MTKKFIPSTSAVMTYTKEFLQRLKVLEKLESNQKYSPSRIEELAYNEMRNYRRELFENPIEWRIAIMKQYREFEKSDHLKEMNQREMVGDAEHHTMNTEKKSIASGLNPHDRDEDEPMGEIKIILPTQQEIEPQPQEIEEKNDERPSPVTEGRINISCVSKENYRKKLEEEYKENLKKRMLR